MIKKLLLFDIDGTLMVSRGATREAKARAMEEVFGTSATVKTHVFGGKTDWQILHEVLEPKGFSVEEIGDKMAYYERIFARYLAEIIHQFEVRPLPGALELIAQLRERKDLLLGLVTGNTSATAPVKLRAAGFDPSHFLVGAFGNESHNRNDLPRLALERANSQRHMNLSPADVIVIGDTPADVECARALGAVAVTVFTGFAERDELIATKPDYLLDDLTQFLAVVPLT